MDAEDDGFDLAKFITERRGGNTFFEIDTDLLDILRESAVDTKDPMYNLLNTPTVREMLERDGSLLLQVTPEGAGVLQLYNRDLFQP